MHDSVCDTIRENLGNRAFKYGNFTRRAYSNGNGGHGKEFLITKPGLAALASIMRYEAKKKIAEVYAGAWRTSRPALPAPSGAAGIQGALPAAESSGELFPVLPSEHEARPASLEVIRSFEDKVKDLTRDFEIEKDAKNRAYGFIIAADLMSEFQRWCKQTEGVPPMDVCRGLLLRKAKEC